MNGKAFQGFSSFRAQDSILLQFYVNLVKLYLLNHDFFFGGLSDYLRDSLSIFSLLLLWNN